LVAICFLIFLVYKRGPQTLFSVIASSRELFLHNKRIKEEKKKKKKR